MGMYTILIKYDKIQQELENRKSFFERLFGYISKKNKLWYEEQLRILGLGVEW